MRVVKNQFLIYIKKSKYLIKHNFTKACTNFSVKITFYKRIEDLSTVFNEKKY